MLVGRDECFVPFSELLDGVHRGQGRVLVIEGEAGIGKSAFLAACADRARDAGLEVLVGRSDVLGATRPFAPLLDALARGPDGAAAREAFHGLLTEHATRPVGPAPDPGMQALLVEELVMQVERLCLAQPTMLCVDDLHWADGSTVAALAALARRSLDLPLLLGVATRHTPPESDARAFLDIVDTSVDRTRVTRLGLTRLSAEDVIALSGQTLAAPPSRRLSSLLDGCAGNPLLVVELLASLADADLLVARDGEVDLTTDPADLELPTSLTETVHRRMAHLDGDARALATLAALLESSFTLGDLASITGRPASDLLPGVQALVDARLFADEGGTLSYRHALVRDAVRSALPASVRADLHGQIADALRAAGAPTRRVAEQLVLAAPTDAAEAVGVLRDAAEEIVAHDPAAAELLLRRAIELCSPTDPQRDLLLARLVDALIWSGHLGEASDAAEEALSRPVDPEPEMGLRSGLGRALLLLGRAPAAIPHEDRVIELYRAAGRVPAWPLAEAAVCRAFALDLEGARDHATQAAQAAEADGDEAALIVGLSVQSFVHSSAGRADAACELASQAARLADATPGGEGHRLHPNLYRAMAMYTASRPDDAMRAIERGRALGESLGAAWALPLYHFVAALILWDKGDWDDLLAELDAGLAYEQEGAPSLGELFACALAARVHISRGDLDRAGERLAEGDRLVARHGLQFGADWLLLVRGLLLEAQGHSENALTLLSGVWQTAISMRTNPTAVLVGPDVVRIQLAEGERDDAHLVADELAAIAAGTPHPAALACARRARGLVRGDPTDLLGAADAFAELGQPFPAALARGEAAVQLAIVGDTAQAGEVGAVSLRALDALGAALEASRLRERLGERDRPSARAVSGWESLTPTEWEVAEEVCAGRSNAEVAARLGISRRTVEAHLRSIYPKMGVSTRLALAVAHRERT